MTDILRFRVPWRLTVAAGAILVPAALAGCALFSFAAVTLAPHTKAEYELAQVPTLVLVDDFDVHLRDPALANFIAGQVGENLKHRKAIKTTIPIARLNAVAAELGEDYRRTPVSRVARSVGAAQVICVNIVSVSIMSDPGIMEPTAELWVKVIDAEGNRRFPPTREGAPRLSHGRPMTVRMPHRYLADGDDTSTPVVMRTLAQRVARDVARLFHNYDPNEPDES